MVRHRSSSSMRFFLFGDIEAEEGDIAILHHIILSFQPHQTLFLGGIHGAAGLQILKGHDLGADKAALKIAVDLAGGLGSLHAPGDGPGAHLILTAGEGGDIAQQVIAGLNEAIQAPLGEPQLRHEHLGLLGLHAGDVLLELGGNRQHGGVLLGSQRGQRLEVIVILPVGHAVLAEVGHVDNGLDAEETAVLQNVMIGLGEGEEAGGLAVGQVSDELLAHFHFPLMRSFFPKSDPTCA